MLFFKRILFVSIYFCCAAPSWAVPPGDTWFTIETTHFHVHHTEAQKPFAKAFANALEHAFPLLTHDLAWTPHTPFDIIINDASDNANGFSSSVPDNHMEVYAVPFPTESSLGDYDNWVEELATHELTHIVANDTGFGAYKSLRSVFGSVIKPNGLQPVWLVEGLAVFEETNLTSGGRGRSLITESLLRTAASHHKLNSTEYIRLDRFNDGVFWWPAGNTPYLLGYTIQASAEGERHHSIQLSQPIYGSADQSIPGMISANNASRVPFFIDSNVESILDNDWNFLWAKSLQKLEQRYPASGVDENNPAFCQLSHGGRFTGGQAMTSDGWIYFTLEHVDHGSVLARARINGDCHNPAFEVLATRDLGGTSQVAVSPDQKSVAYSEWAVSDGFHNFSELRIFDLESHSVKKIGAPGMRGFDPSFSSDGHSLFFIHNLGDGRQALAKIGFNEGDPVQDIFVGESFHRLSHPFVWKDSVFFSRHSNDGKEDILRISETGGPAVAAIDPNQFLKGERYSEQDPSVDSEGNLYYSAYYSSGSNSRSVDIYRLARGAKTPERIVQSASGYLSKPIALEGGNTLIAANYYLNGFDLVRIDRSKKENLIAGLPALPKALHEAMVENSKESPKPGTPSAAAEAKPSEPYSFWSSPASSLWPHYWLPSFAFAPDGYFAGASTSGTDPLGQHQYEATLLYDSRAKFPTYSALYSNWVYPVGISLFARQKNSYFQGSKTSNRESLYALEATIPADPWYFNFGFSYQQRHYFGSFNDNPFVFTDFRYLDGRKTPSAIAMNQGLILDSYLAYYPANNLEHEFADWRPEIDVFTPGIFRSHSVALSLRAGITTNQFLASNYYLGGGVSALSSTQDFIVHGYPGDVLLGQRIATANFSYTLPLSRPYTGFGTAPFFFREFGARFLADAGSANYTALYSGSEFLGYEQHKLGGKVLYGIGAELLLNSTALYYVPFNLVLGLHQGLQQSYGGTTSGYFGINASLPGLSGNVKSAPSPRY